MKSRIFGVLTCASFLTTSVAYLSVSLADAKTENPTSVTVHSPLAESHQTGIFRRNKKETKATSLSAVGWKGCSWCKKLKETTLPTLVEQGYDVRYVDLKDWKGPKVTAGPTLFYFDGKKIVKIEKGYRTADEVKKYLVKPSLVK